MHNYALAVVPAGWEEASPLTFSAAQHQDIRDKIESGTRVLLYRQSPADDVIGQAQVVGTFLETSEWPKENLGNIDPSDPGQAYLLPLDVVFLLKEPQATVPGDRVREVLNDSGFPHGGERWRTLTADQYQALRDGWVD